MQTPNTYESFSPSIAPQRGGAAVKRRPGVPVDRGAMIPASGGVLYYPAEHRGTFKSVRDALGSIGCVRGQADDVIAQAAVNGSPSIALPVSLPAYPGDRFAAVIARKPGGRADLWLGLLEAADEDRTVALGAARQFAEASGKTWGIFEWVRQSEPQQ
jgi:hypothetical protein